MATTAEEHEVRALHRAVLDVWNQRDAAEMAAHFTGAGTVVGFDGSTVDGRDEIASHLGTIFADHETAAYVAIVRDVRVLGPDAALLRATVGMVPPGQHDINPETNAIQTLVVQREGDRWQIASMQSTPAAFHGRPEAAQELTDELRGLLPNAAS